MALKPAFNSRAEVSGLAGAGKQVVMTTLIAIEAGKAMQQFATGEETLEDFGLDRPMDEPGEHIDRPVLARGLP